MNLTKEVRITAIESALKTGLIRISDAKRMLDSIDKEYFNMTTQLPPPPPPPPSYPLQPGDPMYAAISPSLSYLKRELEKLMQTNLSGYTPCGIIDIGLRMKDLQAQITALTPVGLPVPFTHKIGVLGSPAIQSGAALALLGESSLGWNPQAPGPEAYCLQHEWLDLGMRVSYCKTCDAKGLWNTTDFKYETVES